MKKRIDQELIDQFKAQAERGDATAQIALGVFCLAGAGVPKAEAEAMRWYRKAAKQGNLEAQLGLGFFYVGTLKAGAIVFYDNVIGILNNGPNASGQETAQLRQNQCGSHQWTNQNKNP